MRANMPAFGKTRPMRSEDFAAFEAAYGDEPNGSAARKDEGPDGRFRYFSRTCISGRNDSLDIAWLRDDNDASEDALSDPEDIAAAILGHLRSALAEIDAIEDELATEDTAPTEVAA